MTTNNETPKKDFNATIGNTVICDGFLVPMTDFVLEQLNEQNSRTKPMREVFNSLEKYATFLRQPLKLEMFVPCVDGSPIEYFELKKTGGKFCQVGSKIEKEAKGKILFEDFELISETDETWLFKINGNFPRIVGKKLTIESLRIFKDKIKLSQSALNAIFG